MKKAMCIFNILLLFTSQAYPSIYSLGKVDIHSTDLWSKERTVDGWSRSFEKEVLQPFIKHLELRVVEFLPNTYFTGTERLFYDLLEEIRYIKERDNIYRELIVLGFKTSFLLTLHYNRLSLYHSKDIYWNFIFEGMSNYTFKHLNFAIILSDPKGFPEHLFSRIYSPVNENDYDNFDLTVLSDIIVRNDVFLVPTMDSLDIELFVKLSPIRIFPLGISFDAINRHDGAKWSPFVFYFHDVGHAVTQVKDIKGSALENSVESKVFLLLYEKIKKTEPLLSYSVVLLLFQLLHEDGKSYCGLSKEDLKDSDYEDAIPLIREKVKYEIYPFKSKDKIDSYLRRASQLIKPIINQINCYD